jgi:hypothetical protein
MKKINAYGRAGPELKVLRNGMGYGDSALIREARSYADSVS